MTDAKGNVSDDGYDASGRMTSLADALGNTTRFEHDALGNRTKLLKPNGEHLAYAYDLGNRLTTIGDQTGSRLASLTWDALDRLVLMDAPDVKTAYTYDAGGRMTKLDYLSMGHALEYTYDKDGLRKSMALAGELTNYGYDASGRQTLRTFPNGVRSSYAYDAKGQLLSLAHRKRDGALLNSFTYQYDQNGNRTSATDNLGRHEYGYDRLDRLTSAAEPFGLKQTYAYDPVGNRTKLTKERKYPTTPVPPGKPAMTLEEINYLYDAADRLLKAGTTDYVFDAVGRTREVRYPGGNVTRFEYDSYDRPSRISGLRHHLTGEPLTDSLYAYAPQLPDLRFTPAPLGVRVKKTDSKGVTKYVVDNTGNGAAELDQANDVKARYRHTAAIDDPLGMRDAQGRGQSMQLDGLGSVSMLTDALGNMVQGYTYDPFGMPNATGHEANSLKYTGRTWDADAQMQENKARYLNPGLGRWTASDPLFLAANGPVASHFYLQAPQRLHDCTYATNNPATLVDPFGLLADIPLRALILPGSVYDKPDFVKVTNHLVRAATTWRNLANITVRIVEKTSLCAPAELHRVTDPNDVLSRYGKPNTLTVFFTTAFLVEKMLFGFIPYPIDGDGFTPPPSEGLKHLGIIMGASDPSRNVLAHEIGQVLLGPKHTSGLMDDKFPKPEKLSTDQVYEARGALERLRLPLLRPSYLNPQTG